VGENWESQHPKGGFGKDRSLKRSFRLLRMIYAKAAKACCPWDLPPCQGAGNWGKKNNQEGADRGDFLSRLGELFREGLRRWSSGSSELARGWVGYFYMVIAADPWLRPKAFWKRECALRIYLRRKHRQARKGYRSVKFLYGDLGLYKIPATAPWTQTAKAAARR
jgi:hypothetical protein